GNGYLLTVPVSYTGAGRAPGVVYPADENARAMIALGVTLAILSILVAYYTRQRALGRFAPLVPLRDISPYWLEKYVFVHLPEVAGAAWDDNTSAPEVAATLARLVHEKKLMSSVKTTKV